MGYMRREIQGWHLKYAAVLPGPYLPGVMTAYTAMYFIFLSMGSMI
ncbi:hypothetical protein SAMN05660900_02793 [Megasphaera cerevisiae DSM 20462]|nr:hypothetical protein SAMN05660900_02793 [Megasphaera cerevisiae DSM 20462]